MEKFSISEVIEQAVQTEKLGYQFYTTMAKRFEKDEGLKKLFDMLATKELRHEKMFTELKEISGEEEPEGWEEASSYLRAIVESEFFLGKNSHLPQLEHVRTVEDAVNFAMGFEKETLLYFHAVSEIVKEKDVVDEIINEERSHIKWLARFKESFKAK
ncbi:MAG: ferritin family protein [Nitrospirae bacterium]|nr:ferritin family protein [Nitrospirota bacterium]